MRRERLGGRGGGGEAAQSGRRVPTGFTLDSLESPGRRRKSAAENVEAFPIIASQIDKKQLGGQ